MPNIQLSHLLLRTRPRPRLSRRHQATSARPRDGRGPFGAAGSAYDATSAVFLSGGRGPSDQAVTFTGRYRCNMSQAWFLPASSVAVVWVRPTQSVETMPVESRPIRDAAIHVRLLQQYLLLLKKYPILTKSVTRLVAFFPPQLHLHNCFTVNYSCFPNIYNWISVFSPNTLHYYCRVLLTMTIDPDLFWGVNNGVGQSASAEKNSPCKFLQLLYQRHSSTLCTFHW